MTINDIISNALDDIPLIKDGKRGIDELYSFHFDISMLKKFKQSLNLRPENQKKYSEQWKEFKRLRNEEDFVPFSKSENQDIYNSMFLW